jgi:hypothetical protein
MVFQESGLIFFVRIRAAFTLLVWQFTNISKLTAQQRTSLDEFGDCSPTMPRCLYEGRPIVAVRIEKYGF